MNTVNKILEALGHNTDLHYDLWTSERQFVAEKRKWIANILPVELLNRSFKKNGRIFSDIESRWDFF